MHHSAVGGLIAFVLGIGIALANHCLNLYAIKKSPQTVMLMSLPRQLIHILFLVALYFLAPMTPWDHVPLLIGGVLGMTLPMIFLTRSLLSRTNQDHGGDENG